MTGSPAAGRRATSGFRRRFQGADESAREFAVDLRADGFRIKARRLKKFACVLDAVNTSGFDVDGCESGPDKFLAILVFFEPASDATDPELHAFANGGGSVAADHHIRYRQPPAGLKDAKGFTERGRDLCRRKD